MRKKAGAMRLNAVLLIAACKRLRRRIEARFPASGLGRVCDTLVETAKTTEVRVYRLTQPYWLTRTLSALPLMLLVGLVGFVAVHISWQDAFRSSDTADQLQGLEALVSLIVLLSGAIWFIASTEIRHKRRDTLCGLFELRSIAHVIDMHQLTKYPSSELRLMPTAASMTQELSDAELARYLDYCTEMLALVAKLAALYAAETQGPEVTSAIGDVEDLTSDLGRRIWQKSLQINEQYK